MASAVRQERPDRDGSCFSRAARAIRRALSRICGDTSPSVPTPDPSIRDHAQSGDYEMLNTRLPAHYSVVSRTSEIEYGSLRQRRRSDHVYESVSNKRTHLVSPRILEGGYKSQILRRSRPRRDAYDSSYKKSLPLIRGSRLQRAPIMNRVIQDLADTEGSKEQEEFKMMSVGAESESGDVSDALVTVEAVVTAENYSATNAQQTRPDLQMSSHPGSTKRDSSCLSRSHSVPSLSQISSAKKKTFTRSQSLPDMLIKSSSEEFTPETPVYGDTSEDIIIPPSSPKIDVGEDFMYEMTSSGFPWHSIDYTTISEDLLYDATEIKLHSTAGPSNLQLSTIDDDDSDSGEFYGKRARMDWRRGCDEDTTSVFRPAFYVHGGYFPSTPSQTQDQNLLIPNRKDTDDGGPSFDNCSSSFSRPSCSQSTAATVWGPPRPQDSPVVLQNSTEGSRAQDDDVLMEMETSDTPLNLSVTNNQSTHSHLQLSSSDPGWTERDSSCLSHSHSVPSLSQTTSPENKTFTRSQSLPDLLLKSSFEEFTPDISVDEDDETYRFQCFCPGLYQCSVTGLVFHMEGEGDVVYRTVPWDRRLLAQHHKKPAGPLFDIKCLQQSVCQLHLPHCEIRSTGGCKFLSVAHVNDEGIEFIVPQKITETHVIINITGFSGYGNVKDEDSPPDPVRALVLLFYRPPADPDPESLLNVLLLPVNIVLQDVLRTRKKLFEDEIYIETSSHCKLCPNQEYTLSTCPEDDSVIVQPTEAEFDSDNYDNYFPSFQVILEKIMKHIKLFLRENKSSKSVWERRVCLSSTAVKRSCGPSALNLPSNDRLLDIRSSFIDGISGPVLKSLLDKLLEKTVLTDSERESADGIQNHRDKARFVIDTVRKKGEAASSEMIEFLCEVDLFLCKHLGLI